MLAQGPLLAGVRAGGWMSDVAGGPLRSSRHGSPLLEKVGKSAARSAGSSVGREIVRSVPDSGLRRR